MLQAKDSQRLLTDILDAKGLSETQKEKVGESLLKAIQLNATSRLVDLLSVEQKKTLENSGGNVTTFEDLLGILSSTVGAEKAKEVFTAALDDVLLRFLDKI